MRKSRLTLVVAVIAAGVLTASAVAATSKPTVSLHKTAVGNVLVGPTTAGAGLSASKLGTTKRKDGKLQVTYGGHPLYSFAPDKKAGDVTGQGVVHFGGAWWVVSSAGAKITTKP